VLAQSCVGRAFDPFASVAGHALLATAQAPRRAGLLAALHPARRRAAQHDIARADRAIGRDGYFHGALGCVSQMLCVALPMTASEENYALCVTAPAVRRDGEILPALIERSADVARRVARLLQ
jgi:DNA-binding IclR family transcriptional regulator